MAQVVFENVKNEQVNIESTDIEWREERIYV